MKGFGRVKFIFSGKNSIPLICLSFDRTGFDHSLDLTMELDPDMAYFTEIEVLVDDLIATLWVSETIIPISRLKPRIARLFPILYPSEEGLHRFIETLEDILLHLAVNVLIFFSQLFDRRKLVGLHGVGNRRTRHSIGLTSFFQSSIVKLLTSSQRPFQDSNLLLCRIDTEFVRLVAKIGILRFAFFLR